MQNRTFTIIKPNAVADGNTGKIIDRLIDAGFNIDFMRMLALTRSDAERFYAIHRERPFFDELIEFMTSGRIVVMELSLGDSDAIGRLRTLVGCTDPAKAAPGTIRALYGRDVTQNAIHASDSLENAEAEAAQFFPR